MRSIVLFHCNYQVLNSKQSVKPKINVTIERKVTSYYQQNKRFIVKEKCIFSKITKWSLLDPQWAVSSFATTSGVITLRCIHNLTKIGDFLMPGTIQISIYLFCTLCLVKTHFNQLFCQTMSIVMNKRL